uniref:ATP8 protein n=1 Tax=Cephus sareptanus TaxID=1001277 RepID=A0A0B5E7S7_9HYME|nr:ATP synthase F0 subunit 8 [Cephus sareptanus]
MPQMSPMNWLMLMFMFTLTMIMCMSMIYFIYLPNNLNNQLNTNKLTQHNSNSKKKFMTWKW